MGKTKNTTSETLKIRVHKDALRDITDINIYIGITRQQPLNVFKVSIAIEQAIEKIGQHPFAFTECEENLCNFNQWKLRMIL